MAVTLDNIPQFPMARYEIDVSWYHLERALLRYAEDYQLNLDPDFQRAHVWTRAQQRAYVEYILSGGEVARVVVFHCPGWHSSMDTGLMELVDGKQRIEAVRSYMRDEFKAHGHVASDFGSSIRSHRLGFKFRIVELATRADLLRLYLNINAGGTPHSKREINRVRKMLDEELKRSGS